MTFHMPSTWYDPPDPFECVADCEERGRECTCEEDAREAAEDARDDALIARDDADRGR